LLWFGQLTPLFKTTLSSDPCLFFSFQFNLLGNPPITYEKIFPTYCVPLFAFSPRIKITSYPHCCVESAGFFLVFFLGGFWGFGCGLLVAFGFFGFFFLVFVLVVGYLVSAQTDPIMADIFSHLCTFFSLFFDTLNPKIIMLYTYLKLGFLSPIPPSTNLK